MPIPVSLSFPPSEEPPSIHDQDSLCKRAARKLRMRHEMIALCEPTKLSFDGRYKHRVWRMQVDVYEKNEPRPQPRQTEPPTFRTPAPDAPHVVIIGSGPAGMFCALDLLAAGMRVSLLERGADVRGRRNPLQQLNRGQGVNPDTNYCFGEGGAGTFSDGKLYTRAGRKPPIQRVLKTLVAHGAPEEILVNWRPHVGSNRLPEVVTAMRETIERSGGQVFFNTRAEEIESDEVDGERRVKSVWVRDLNSDPHGTDKAGLHPFDADAVVLATGHSALDAVLMARRAGAELAPKGFAMGVRVEHPQDWLDERQYGGLRPGSPLPASFYELTSHVNERGVYSFCMCPGGFMVPATTAPDRLVINGMSLSARDSPFANSGLVSSIEPEDWCGERGREWGWDQTIERALALGAKLGVKPSAGLPESPEQDPLFGIRIQMALEVIAADAGGGAGRAPALRTDQWVAGANAQLETIKTSYRPGLQATDLAQVLPPGLNSRLVQACQDFDKKLPGFISEFGQAVAIESRTSAPIRILRDEETLQAQGLAGLYPSGEGAGYAGGIVSAAIDGMRVAEALVAITSN